MMAEMTEQAADAAIVAAARGLRLSLIAKQGSDLADQAEREQSTYRRFLADVLTAEHDLLIERRHQRRVKRKILGRARL